MTASGNTVHRRWHVRFFLSLAVILGLIGAAGGAAAAPGTHQALFSGGARGTGRCALTGLDGYVCTFAGRFRGKLDGIQRHGRFHLQVYVEELLETGAPAPAVSDGSIARARMRLAFAPSNGRPGRVRVGGWTAKGTATPNPDGTLALEAELPIGKSRISIVFAARAKWEPSEVDAAKNEVAIETLEIVHEGFEPSSTRAGGSVQE
jgi:hypothetical protein